METIVELINNPYAQRLQILINKEAISVYSNLEKYVDEPFYDWCDKILDDIFEECNQSKFCLHFCSRQEEIAVMEKIVRNYPNCTQFSSSILLRPTPLLERIKSLNHFIRENKIVGYRSFKKEALFLISDTMCDMKEELRELEVKNVFCEIKANVMSYQEYEKNPIQADIIFLLSNNEKIEDWIKRLKIKKGFGIVIRRKMEFQRKIEDIFLYETIEEKIFETIFECLLFSPLMEAFYLCIHSMTIDIKNKYKEDLEKLQSVSFKIIPKPEKTMIELGRSSRIQFETDMKDYIVKGSQLHYSYSKKGIIRCNGILVEGLKEGNVVLYIFQEGEQIPCAEVAYTVIRRNRITSIELEENVLFIGEGDRTQIQYSFFPVDADNTNLIEWSSDNKEVVTVDSRGILRAVKKGRCMIRCYAEQVSASCQCIVKPHLESITIGFDTLEMIYGQEKRLEINLKPNDCIDDEIVISSMDMQIVNVVGGTIKAVGMGSTRIVVQNVEETVRAEAFIQVMSERDYKRLQEEREGKRTLTKKNKKGWLSKLFG